VLVKDDAQLDLLLSGIFLVLPNCYYCSEKEGDGCSFVALVAAQEHPK
jgi:hypothetical protein